jgi:hypothetical protein
MGGGPQRTQTSLQTLKSRSVGKSLGKEVSYAGRNQHCCFIGRGAEDHARANLLAQGTA